MGFNNNRRLKFELILIKITEKGKEHGAVCHGAGSGNDQFPLHPFQ
jgi:hypothetical protein